MYSVPFLHCYTLFLLFLSVFGVRRFSEVVYWPQRLLLQTRNMERKLFYSGYKVSRELVLPHCDAYFGSRRLYSSKADERKEAATIR